jgi:hypothetical protein
MYRFLTLYGINKNSFRTFKYNKLYCLNYTEIIPHIRNEHVKKFLTQEND